MIMEWLTEVWINLTWARIGIGLALLLVSFLVSTALMAFVMVKIPENYFSSHYQQDFLPNSSWLTRWGVVVLKNAAGIVLIVAGIIMLVGPGPGVLTILIGSILIDIPGKRPLEAKVLNRPAVLAAANSLRAKYGKPPLIMD